MGIVFTQVGAEDVVRSTYLAHQGHSTKLSSASSPSADKAACANLAQRFLATGISPPSIIRTVSAPASWPA
ncbi:hypothetical protein ACOMHN_028657 [Nucella lapillus]